MVSVCSFCKKAIAKEAKCTEYYASLKEKSPGFYQCPFGFTTRTFYFSSKICAITGLIGYPRFDTDNEREKAKHFPDNKVARQTIESLLKFYRSVEDEKADAIQSASKVLPQAFHELRKLNGAILQHAERELKVHALPALQTIKSAAELMRNNFDILEALSNIDVMRALPLDETINLFDLAYKTKMVHAERARGKHMPMTLEGVRAIVAGSPKSLPIVPAVLIENAIKYGRQDTPISLYVGGLDNVAYLWVENVSDYPIDPVGCFERCSRYAPQAAEGGGFGLYLAREIVHAHNGSIRCERKDKVVKFTVEMPLIKVIAF